MNYKESKKDVKISRSEDDTLSKIKENYWISVFHHQINNKDFPDLNMWLKRNFSYYCRYENIKLTAEMEKEFFNKKNPYENDPIIKSKIIIPARFKKV